MPFRESELIITPRGSVYHLDLKSENVGDYVILVGDPDRVKEVSKHFDAIEFKTQNREFITHTGKLGNKRVTVVSTGIGVDNIDIVLNELDAAVNIDLSSREVKAEKRVLNLIRIGTTGSIQPDLEVDEYIASAYVIGLDGLLNYYKYNKSIEQMDVIDQFIWQTGYPYIFAKPYVFKADEGLLRMMKEKCHTGITITAPGFYAPQGRQLRYDLMNPELIDNYTKFRYGSFKATNLEMEASAIYGLGSMLGHKCCTVCAVVANRVNKTFSKDGHAAVDGLIKFVLQSIAKA